MNLTENTPCERHLIQGGALRFFATGKAHGAICARVLESELSDTLSLVYQLGFQPRMERGVGIYIYICTPFHFSSFYCPMSRNFKAEKSQT